MKRLLVAFCGLIALAAVTVFLVLKQRAGSSNLLTMPDGSVLRIRAVTYGTNHVFGSPLARLTTRLPVVRPLLSKIFGAKATVVHTTTTSDPTLVVWLERTTNDAPKNARSGYFETVLSDSTGFVSGPIASMSGWWSNPERLSFRAFPRRDPVVTLNFYHHNPGGKITRCGSLSFRNPLYGPYPQWKPETLPATRRAGDLEVTLEKLSTGHGNNTVYKTLNNGRNTIEFGTNRDDGRNTSVCMLHARSLTDTSQVWRIAGVEVSDATGNQVHNTSLGWGGYRRLGRNVGFLRDLSKCLRWLL